MGTEEEESEGSWVCLMTTGLADLCAEQRLTVGTAEMAPVPRVIPTEAGHHTSSRGGSAGARLHPQGWESRPACSTDLAT